MLSPELEARISQIIEKLNKLSLKENNSNDKITPLESEKYEYRIQKNAQKRMSQITTKVTDFFFEDEDGKKINPEQKSENTESSKISPSIALNMKRLIKIGEFQIELEKLLEILEFSLNEESADKKNELMEKYINDITFVSDENSMNDEIKMKKFGESLEKKYRKIAQLLKGYIKENLIVNNIMEKEKKNKIIKKGKRRSLFDNIPLINEKENKVLKDFPNFGNTFLSEMKEDIKKNKRYSCVNIDKTNIVKNISDEENSESDNEDVNEDNNNNKVYRPGKLRSSLCFDNLFIC